MTPRNRRIKIAIAAGAVAILTLSLAVFLPAATDPIGRAILAAAAPLHRAAVALRGSDSCQEEGSLKAEVGDLKVLNGKLQSLAAENTQLKALADYRERADRTGVTARVVYEAADGSTGVWLIDRGATDGVSAGQPVVAGDSIIVGKVLSVGRLTARVLPLTDSDSRLAVTLMNVQETIGVLEGDRGLSMAVKLIPQSERVSVGDVVITSGLEMNIRRGLIVGIVESVERSTQEPFQTALIAPLDQSRHPVFVMVLPTIETGPAGAETGAGL